MTDPHEVTDDHAVLRSATGVGPYLEFLRTAGVKTVWNRVHLDLKPYPGDDQEAEVARLGALGATGADVGQGNVPWMVLADPEGNEFCVLTAAEPLHLRLAQRSRRHHRLHLGSR